AGGEGELGGQVVVQVAAVVHPGERVVHGRFVQAPGGPHLQLVLHGELEDGVPPHLDAHAVLQFAPRLHRITVQEGAVGAVQVLDQEALGGLEDAAVPPGQPRVFDAYVAAVPAPQHGLVVLDSVHHPGLDAGEQGEGIPVPLVGSPPANVRQGDDVDGLVLEDRLRDPFILYHPSLIRGETPGSRTRYRDFFSETGLATGANVCDEPLVEPAASAGGPTSRRTPWWSSTLPSILRATSGCSLR